MNVSYGSVLSLCCFLSCVSTNISAFKTPDEFTPLKKVMIYAEGNNLMTQEAVEESVMNSFLADGIDAVPSLEILVPTEEYTAEKVKAILIEKGIDGVLRVDQVAADYHRQHIPEMKIGPSRTEGQIQTYGKRSQFSMQTYQNTVGGFDVEKPRVDYTYDLYEAVSGKKLWTARAFTGGNSCVSLREAKSHTHEEIAERLIKEGVLTASIKSRRNAYKRK